VAAKVIPFPARAPELTLAEAVTRKLILAGYTPDDEHLEAIHDWNHAAYQRAGIPCPHEDRHPPA